MTATATCTAAPTIAAAVSVAVSPNGKSVYVAGLPNGVPGSDNSALTTFNRKDDGSLNQDGIAPTDRCIGPIDNNACATFVALRLPRDVVVTPDNKQVIVTTVNCAGGGGCSVAAFNRNETTGVVGPGNASCIGDGFTCSASPVRGEYTQVVVSKNGDRVYATSRLSNGNVKAVVTLARNSTTGVVTAIGCATGVVPPNCPTAAPALSDPVGLALSPGGDVLYTGSDSGQRIGIFGLDSTGLPVPKPSPFGCIAVAVGCGGAFAQGSNVPYVIPSPDGKYVYALGASRVFSFAVDHPPTCANQTIAVPFNTTVAVTLQCTDPDGDPVSGYALTSQPGRGTAIQQGGSVNYGPLNGSSGADSFTYTAVANGISADPATVTLNVAGAPPGGTTQPSCLDADHDGFCAGQDCNDSRAAIRPGAREVKGNRIDENCDGFARAVPDPDHRDHRQLVGARQADPDPQPAAAQPVAEGLQGADALRRPRLPVQGQAAQGQGQAGDAERARLAGQEPHVQGWSGARGARQCAEVQLEGAAVHPEGGQSPRRDAVLPAAGGHEATEALLTAA